MGQKTNPIGNRLGIIRGWESNWYGGNDYGDKLAEDDKIRKYIHARLAKASVSRVIIERTLKLITVTVTTARPGIIIGKGGQEVDKLKEELAACYLDLSNYHNQLKALAKHFRKVEIPKIDSAIFILLNLHITPVPVAKCSLELGMQPTSLKMEL